MSKRTTATVSLTSPGPETAKGPVAYPGTMAHAATAGSPPVPLREKLAYSVGDIGANLIYSPISTFMLFYLTNIVGIGAAIAGTVLLVGQLMNGVTDLLVGYFIDKTNTRWGKARPWVLFSAVPLVVAFVLLFSVPAGFDETGKVAWVFVMYTLVIAVFYTASNVAYSTLLSVMTSNPKTRVTLTTFRFFSALLTTLVASVVTLPLVESLGNDQGAWTKTAVIYGAIALLTLILVFTGTKERVTAATHSDSSAKQPLGVLLKNLFRNHYFLLAGALFITYFLFLGLTQSAGVYYVANVLGDASLFGLVSIAGILPALLGIGFMPALMGRFSKRKVLLGGITVMFIGSAIPLVAPENLEIVLIGLIVRGLGTVPLTAGIYALVADVVDFGEWRNGVRTDGLIFSVVVFGQKVGGGFGAAIVGWLLAWGGFNAAETHQTAGATQAILASFLYLPLALTVVLAIIMFFFRVEQHTAEIQAYLNRAIEPQPSDPSPNDQSTPLSNG